MVLSLQPFPLYVSVPQIWWMNRYIDLAGRPKVWFSAPKYCC